MSDAGEQPIGDLVGVALAGGSSRRMGRDKARLPLPGATGGSDFVSWTVERLARVCGEVVVADGGRGLVAGRASLADGAGAGPVAGILGAATARPGRRLLVLACDLPLMPEVVLRRLAGLAGDWVVPLFDGRLEPLASVYAPAAVAVLARRVAAGRLDLHGLRHDLDPQRLTLAGPETWHHAGLGDAVFTNVNRPDDFRRFAAARQNCLRASSTSR